ncbi:MAG: hypothetical protein JWO08_3387 [Verrucomicrobiaceae bacterium]|nr:hypothetical protein [Verrucomicrobiaceae bacterium]
MKMKHTHRSAASPHRLLAWLAVIILAGVSQSVRAAAVEFSNTAVINTKPQASSSITVADVPGKVERVSVTLKGFTHPSPKDLDFLLVSPSGRKVLLMSDSGDVAPGVSNLLVTFDDYAQYPVPASVTGNTGRPFISGSYRPTNASNSASLPAPAPAMPYQASLAQFNGDLPNGTWTLYVADASAAGGSLSGGWTISFDSRPPPPAPGAVVISEFRTRGLGTNPPASDGSADEFIELYNTTDSSITLIDALPAADPTKVAGVGWRLMAIRVGGGTQSVVLSQVGGARGPWAIPSHGHFLIAVEPTNPVPAGNTYSLRSYATVIGITASGVPDFSFNPARAEGLLYDDGGLALFSTVNGVNAGQCMDSVGFPNAGSLFKEGAGLGPLTGITTPSQHSWVRKRPYGVVQDTGDNAADFELVEVNGAVLNAATVAAGGVAATLGAPGPERGPSPPDIATTSAPISSPAGFLHFSPIAQVFPNGGYNAQFDPTPVPHGSLGTLKLRSQVSNYSFGALLALRYRIITLTTRAGGTAPAGKADLRVLSSEPSRFYSDYASDYVITQTLTLQEPPAQQSEGGGINSTLVQPGVNPAIPLGDILSHVAPSDQDYTNASRYIEFTFGIEQYGDFEIGIQAEGLTAYAQGVQGLYRVAGHVSEGSAYGEGTVTFAGNGSDRAFTNLKLPVTIDVLANDGLFPGQILTIATQGAYGTATIINGKIRYTPSVNLPAGGDTFTYRYNGIDTIVAIINTSKIAGIYDGLITDLWGDYGIEHEHAGRLQLTIGSNGAYSGTLTFSGLVRTSISGNLQGTATATHTLLREPEEPMILSFAADKNPPWEEDSPATLSGTLTSSDYAGNDFTSIFTLARKTAFPAFAKTYTVLLGGSGWDNSPRGNGYGTAKITAAGDVTLSGRLPDGAAYSLTSILLPGTHFPVYLTPYAKASARGSFRGMMKNYPNGGLPTSFADEDEVKWYKWPRPGELHFPNGINAQGGGFLSPYQPPPTRPATRLLAFDEASNNGKITISFGGIDPDHPITQVFTLAATNVVTMAAPNPAKVALTFTPANGLFTGSFVHPVSKKVTPIAGSVVQGRVFGTGYFLGPRPLQAGGVMIEKNTPAEE